MKLNFTLVFLFVNLSIYAQTRVISNSFYFGTKLNIEKYAGKEFRYTVDVKSLETDSLKNINIQSLQVINADEWLDNNITKDSKSDTLWHAIKTSGNINLKAKEVWLYVTFEGNGNFLADNIKYEVKNANGLWQEISIKNNGFETSLDNPLKGFLSNAKLPDGTTLRSVNRLDDQKGKALQVKTTKAAVTLRIAYGNNKKAGKYCLANGIKLYYETYGTGEPLLLLHGNGQSIIDFNKQIPKLAKRYQVIAVDTRAQGKSKDTTDGKLSYDVFAGDMKVLLDSLHLRKVNIVGWSDGGNTALIMAIKYPEYINKLMIMGANLNPTEKAVKNNMLSQVRNDLKKLEGKADSDSKHLVRLLRMLLIEPNISVDDLHKITSKTLVMAGEKDIIKPEHTKLIAENIKGSKLVIFKKETHMVPEETPELFNSTVLNFLGDINP